MKPENETLEEFKLKCFKFSLTDSAIEWYYSCAEYESCYENLRAKFLKEFPRPNFCTAPCQRATPSFELEIRKKINNLKQSRDETLDEYLWYFDSLITSCPHHGFMNNDLLQRFLGGMMPLEQKRLNDAAGGSIMKITIIETWDLIEDLAESTKQGPMHQTEDKAPTMEVDSVQNKPDTSPITSLPATKPREDISTRAVMDVEAALKEPILEPTEQTEDEDSQITKEEPAKSDPVLITKPVEPLEAVLITNLPEEVSALLDEPNEVPDFAAIIPKTCPILTIEAPKAGLVLIIKLSKNDLTLMVEFPNFSPRLYANHSHQRRGNLC
ncbi:unnamed protein product [Rhodiola kirilowii]